jgi:hypothetical protein
MMRLRFISVSISVLVLAMAFSRAEAACIDTTASTHSAVSIMRRFDEQERQGRPDVLGIRATGWFLSPTTMVTVEHVAAAMKLSDRDWKQLEIREGEDLQVVPARIRRFVGSHAIKLAVLELGTAPSGARGLQLRTEPLVPEEPVVSIAYPGGRQRVVGGRFVQFGDDGKLSGTALLEMYEGDDRLVLDHGSSGAPVLDCAGRVVAVVSDLFTTTIAFMSAAIRVSTGWGNPNVVSVPVSELNEYSSID